MSQSVRRIVREVHDEPHIEGRRLIVQFIKSQVEDRGLAPRTVAGRHDLDIATVYNALTYYHEHPSEMREIERKRHEATESMAGQTTDPTDVK